MAVLSLRLLPAMSAPSCRCEAPRAPNLGRHESLDGELATIRVW